MDDQSATLEANASTPLADLANRHDDPAFDEIVRRFQDMAVAIAYGWLHDRALAEDAAQEAFLELHANLPAVREPSALPGFLRRIIVKQCDRITRRRNPAIPNGNVERIESTLTQQVAEGDDPGYALDQLDRDAKVRAAVASLPEGERLAVSLHHLGGLNQTEIARWTDWPISTVKKRLRSARARLSGDLDGLVARSLKAMRPSEGEGFSATLRLFLAIREADVAAVSEILDKHPELIEANEQWDHQLSRDHALPVANGGTPMVRAAERGNVDVIDELARRGADFDAHCGCNGGERPLWAAVSTGQLRASRRLLELGADPDARAFADHAPLHVAVIRRDPALVALLLEFGADLDVRDAHGRSAADWARTKGDAEIEAMLSTRCLRERVEATRPAGSGAGHSLDNAGLAKGDLLQTGIKVLDLFAPIRAGDRIACDYRPGLGGVVLAMEFSRRWREVVDAPGRAVVWLGWERQTSDRGELQHALEEGNLEDDVNVVWSPVAEAQPGRRDALHRAIDECCRLQGAGSPDVLLVVFASPAWMSEVEAALPRIQRITNGSITTLVMERDPDRAVTQPAARRPGYDVEIVFDPALAAIHHYPCIDATRSFSSALSADLVGAAHMRAVEAARDSIQVLRTIAPDLGGQNPEQEYPDDRELVGRARRVLRYLTQPFVVTEAFVGQSATAPTREESVSGLLEQLDR